MISHTETDNTLRSIKSKNIKIATQIVKEPDISNQSQQYFRHKYQYAAH